MSDAEILGNCASLLGQVGTIRSYEKAFENASGDLFNVFDILRVGHFEAATHTPLLGALLDPAGTHGAGAAFLEKFIRRLGVEEFDSSTAKVYVEYFLGARTKDSGGRIDLLLRDGLQREILLENKIYAADQENQIPRYLNYSPRARLLYLTLVPQELSGSAAIEQPRLRRISYRDDILPWLAECLKEATALPQVRETLRQYMRVIQNLTNQNSNTRMNTKVAEVVLKSRESLEAYTALRGASTAVEEALADWLQIQVAGIARTLGLKDEFRRPLRKPYNGFRFHHPELEVRNLFIGFEFEYGDLQEFCSGFGYIKEGKKSPWHDSLHAALKESGMGRVYQSAYWPGWVIWEQYANWNDPETIAAVRFGSFIADTSQRAEQLLKTALDVVKSDK